MFEKKERRELAHLQILTLIIKSTILCKATEDNHELKQTSRVMAIEKTEIYQLNA